MSSEKASSRVAMRVVGQHAEGVAHHGRARDLAEGADMRQARGAVAGLEQHFVLAGALDARDELARLLERPGLGRLRRGEKRGVEHGYPGDGAVIKEAKRSGVTTLAVRFARRRSDEKRRA